MIIYKYLRFILILLMMYPFASNPNSESPWVKIKHTYSRESCDLWEELGNKSWQMKCEWDIPDNESLSKLQWLHNNKRFFEWWVQPDEEPRCHFLYEYWQRKLKPHSIKLRSQEDQLSILETRSTNFEDEGNFTCQVIFNKSGTQKASARLRVYQLDRHYFFNVTEKDGKAHFVCKAGNIYPEPLWMAISEFDPRTGAVSNEIKRESSATKIGNYYNISIDHVVKGFQIKQSKKIICEVVLNEKPKISRTSWKDDVTNEDKPVPEIEDISEDKTQPDKSALSEWGLLTIIVPAFIGILYLIGMNQDYA